MAPFAFLANPGKLTSTDSRPRVGSGFLRIDQRAGLGGDRHLGASLLHRKLDNDALRDVGPERERLDVFGESFLLDLQFVGVKGNIGEREGALPGDRRLPAEPGDRV
jgi:hypothetical protein